MDNHHHLLLERPEPNPSRSMWVLTGAYPEGMNRRHSHPDSAWSRQS